jgi:translation initiation factor IF-2
MRASYHCVQVSYKASKLKLRNVLLAAGIVSLVGETSVAQAVVERFAAANEEQRKMDAQLAELQEQLEHLTDYKSKLRRRKQELGMQSAEVDVAVVASKQGSVDKARRVLQQAVTEVAHFRTVRVGSHSSAVVHYGQLPVVTPGAN